MPSGSRQRQAFQRLCGCLVLVLKIISVGTRGVTGEVVTFGVKDPGSLGQSLSMHNAYEHYSARRKLEIAEGLQHTASDFQESHASWNRKLQTSISDAHTDTFNVQAKKHRHERHHHHLVDNVSDYKISRSRVQEIAAERDGTLIATWANFKYLDFVENWLAHLHKLHITTYIIGTMDIKLLEALLNKGERNVFFMDATEAAEDMTFGTPFYYAMGREHCRFMEHIVGMGVDALFSDIDTVWLRDPFPFLARYPDADILQTTDSVATGSAAEELENFIDNGNIGIILIRQSALPFLQELNFRLAGDPNLWEQGALVDLVTRNITGYGERQDHLLRGYNNSLLIGSFPTALFPGGHVYFTQDLAEHLGIGQPYVVHNSFCSGNDLKRLRFRERLLWLSDPEEYYDPPGGLISFDLHIDELLEAARHMDYDRKELRDYLPHFNLVNHQLLQVRAAMAIATVLNRTLILPQLWAAVDKEGTDSGWVLDHGVWPGSQNRHLPRVFTADHLLDVTRMSSIDPETSEPRFKFREYSFLNNSKLPADILKDAVEVHICEEHTHVGCHHSYDRAKRQVQVKTGLTDKQIHLHFSDLKDVKLLHFRDMRDVFGGFEQDDAAQRFEERTKHFTSFFCCVRGQPGWVWYDMWWDVQGHVDREGRIVHQYKPILGGKVAPL